MEIDQLAPIAEIVAAQDLADRVSAMLTKHAGTSDALARVSRQRVVEGQLHTFVSTDELQRRPPRASRP